MDTTDRFVVVSGRSLDDLLELVRLHLDIAGDDAPFAREMRGAAASVRTSAIPEP